MKLEPAPQSAASIPDCRSVFQVQTAAMRQEFTTRMQQPDAGILAVQARSHAVDTLLACLWAEVQMAFPVLGTGISLVAVGGYGREELFPYSDVDLLFLHGPQIEERNVKEAVRGFNQQLWDLGLRVSPMSRSLAECARFDPENVEFTLSLLDARLIAGDARLCATLREETMPRLIDLQRKKLLIRVAAVTRARYAKYGNTLFHLEPNLKECPGGLRDVHLYTWLERLRDRSTDASEHRSERRGKRTPSPDLLAAREFLFLVRTFLHLHHGRDDNTLDWQSQDEAAACSLGISATAQQAENSAAYWMRLYFRHARVIEGAASRASEEAAAPARASRPGLFTRTPRRIPHAGFEVREGNLYFASPSVASGENPAHDPEVALAVFTQIAQTGTLLSPAAERELEGALPLLSAHLEDGPGLWRHLGAILTGHFAGRALRAMHRLGILELLVPEFHGIDALVIRDAYHRYTVDEHTFVVIDTLHELEALEKTRTSLAGTATDEGQGLGTERFGPLLRELAHPAAFFLAALLHDTGKGHANGSHALESVRLARAVLERLELDPYEADLVLNLIRTHLEMSLALRRDVFATETIRSFAAHLASPEALRMLTLLTYADIAAVHPDALTTWKAQDLWRLYHATASFLDHHVEEERLHPGVNAEIGEVVPRVEAILPRDRFPSPRKDLLAFLDGLPRRYLQTRTPEQVAAHFGMAQRLAEGHGPDVVQLALRYAPGISEVTLITRDRPMLFASIAGALAAWGMNIITADAFSNAHGVVVDSFRFADIYRTLELNESERGRFVESLRGVLTGSVSLELLLEGRRRARKHARKIQVETRVQFDQSASTQTTLVEVIAQDSPGLLRALSLTLAEYQCNIEVALIDTEGEVAIDVFYVTRAAAKLNEEQTIALGRALEQQIAALP